MKEIINRWYFGLVLIPILVNLLSGTFALPDLLGNWAITVIGILLIIIILGVIEYAALYKKFKAKIHVPKERDKRIVKELLGILDLPNFKDDVFLQDSWYGYKKVTIRSLIDFQEAADQISGRTSDTELNRLFSDFKISIKEFTSFSSNHLYPNGEIFYAPAKDTDEMKSKVKEVTPIMNGMTDKIYNKLEVLMEYIIYREYID